MPLRPPNAGQGPLVGVLAATPGTIRGGGGALSGPPLMLVSIIESEQSYGPWTITLAACTASSGVPPAGSASASLPLDNQTITTLLERALLLKWGAGGASDQVLLDYPWSGGTFTVHAGQVTLNTVDRTNVVLPAPPNVIPNVAAWCTPGVRACNFQPTVTTFVAAAPNVATVVAVHKRARAYMLTAAASAVADLRTMTTVVAQLNAATNTVLSRDRTVVGGAVWSASTPAQLWTPLMPGATALQLGATGAGLGLDRDVRVVFALDVG